MGLQSVWLLGAAFQLLSFTPVLADGLYSKSSPVLQVDARSYDRLIAHSNHTSIIEFYAPWCGHCQNLKPAYEKAAKNLHGLAKVAAVNCDEESNKPFCGSMGVQGFPTLKIVRPSKKSGRPVVDDYKGARSAKAIADAVIQNIPNHVRQLSDKDLELWLGEGQGTPKALLFSDKGTVSPLLKALAVDFLGGIDFAQMRDKEKKAVDQFRIKSFPTLLVLRTSAKDATVYDGELKKEPMVAFLSRVKPPNPDPAPAASRNEKRPSTDQKKERVKATKDSSSFSAASSAHASAEAEEGIAGATSITLEDFANPTESPTPNIVTQDTAATVVLSDTAPALVTLQTETELLSSCRLATSPLCLLALLPATSESETASTNADRVIADLAAISHKHTQRNAKLFPFYAVPASNPGAAGLKSLLGVEQRTDTEIIALNAKRSWWVRYNAPNMGKESLENWIDAIRMGDVPRAKLPDGVVVAEKQDTSEEQAGKPIKINLEHPSNYGPLNIEIEEIVDEHDEL